MSLSLHRYTIKNFSSHFPSNPRSPRNTNSHSVASRLTRSSARMGALEPELEILETHDTPLNLPEDRLQEDAPDTTCAPGESQPVAMENEILALRTRMAQLERDLAVAHNRIRDLSEINSLLPRTAHEPAPAGAAESAQRLPPPEVPAPPESRQSSMLPPATPACLPLPW